MEITKAVDIVNRQQLDFEPANVYSRNGYVGFYRHAADNEKIYGKWKSSFAGCNTFFDTEIECRNWIIDMFDDNDSKNQQIYNKLLDNELKDMGYGV